MGCEWPTKSFAELINSDELRIGDGYRAKNDELGGDGLIFLRAGQVTDSHISFLGVDRFHHEDAKRYGEKISRSGDVVITTKGNSTGRVSYVTSEMPPFVYSPHLSYWRASVSGCLNQSFLRAWSRGPEFVTQLGALSRSTDMAPYLSLTDQRRLSITIPSIEIQSWVGAFNSAIEERIDLLRQTNTTLDAIAQALFKSWFVDFDPVHAKAEDRELEAMDAATAALFPSEFEASELGLIPKGWRSMTFGDAAYLSKGSVNPVTMPDTEFDHYSLPAFDVGQLPVREVGNAIKSNKTPVPSWAVLVSKLNPHIPRIWPVGEAGTNAVCSTEFLVWVPKAPASSVFVYCLASSQPFNSAMRQLVTGTSNSHQRVKPDQLNGLLVCAASDAALEAFSATASPLLQRILDNRQQAATLAHLRDTLLPRLISGKLRLPNAEREIEATA